MTNASIMPKHRSTGLEEGWEYDRGLRGGEQRPGEEETTHGSEQITVGVEPGEELEDRVDHMPHGRRFRETTQLISMKE